MSVNYNFNFNINIFINRKKNVSKYYKMKLQKGVKNKLSLGDYTTKDIDEVIEYFENTEEYEKCGELLNEKKAKEMAEFDLNLINHK